MSLERGVKSTTLEWARAADKRWQRWRNPYVRRILVDANAPMIYAHIAPIHNAMRPDPRVAFYFTSTEDPERAPAIYRDAGAGVRLISPKRAMLIKFDAYLSADVELGMTLPRGTRRIGMSHGVAGKFGYHYDAPNRSLRKWHRLFFINRRRLQNHIAAGAIDADSPAARLIGMPKVDCLVNGTYERNAVLSSLGIDPGRPAVLYAPTWTAYSSLNTVGEELITRLGRAGYAVIVKLHDHSLDWHAGKADWAARLRPVLRESGGCLVTVGSSCPYLAAADILITDHSSVGFEYMLLDRPLIRIEMPALIAKTSIHPDYVALLSRGSTTVQDAAGAVAAVESSLADPVRQSAQRKEVTEELFYKPGSATARAVREIYEVIELDPA